MLFSIPLEVLSNTSLDCSVKFSYTQYMLTLSQASRETKQILKWGGIFFTGLMIFLVLLRLATIIKNAYFPTITKPTIAFGKLQPQNFPANAVNQNFTYSINTLTGGLPNLSSQLKVYRMRPFQPDLLAVNKFQNRIKNAGFEEGYTAISDKIFEWKSNQNYGGIEKKVRFNTINNNFTVTSLYKTDADVLSAKNLPTETKAIDIATNFLKNIEALPEDIDLEKIKTNLFSIQNESLITATSLSKSQVIEVNFFQKDINKLPIFYEKPNSSNISILIAGGKYQGQVVGVNFIYQPILEESSTYPLKSVTAAYEELKNGQAYIASYFGTSENITITNVFLAYYIGSQTQDFLMPVFVFEGNDGFFAYVPAVTDEWINK